jgi:hypothetical protein
MRETITCPTANTAIAVMNEITMPLDRLVPAAGADADTVSLIMLIHASTGAVVAELPTSQT